MKRVFFSLLLFFSGFLISQVSLASAFDCSFTCEELSKITPQQFHELSQEQKVELSLLSIAGQSDNDAAILFLCLPLKTRGAAHCFAEGIPPVIYNYCAGESESSRRIAFKMTLKAIRDGMKEELLPALMKNLLTGGISGAF
jgi:hypothetical protein